MGIPTGSTHYQEFSGPNVSLAEAVPGCPAPIVLSAEMQALIARPDCFDVVWTDLLGNVVPFYAESKPSTWWVRVPSVPAGTTGTPLVQCYVGDPAAVDQSNAAGTVAGYTGVWPLGDAGPTYAYDMTGNGYTLTQSGGVTFGATGQVDGACSFDGGNDFLATPYAPAFDFAGAGRSFCVSGWVYTAKTTSDGGFVGRWYNNQVATQQWVLKYESDNASLKFAIQDTSIRVAQSAANSVPVNTWVHIAALAASGTALIYVNGTPSGSSVSYGAIRDIGTSVGIDVGADNRPGVPEWWSGSLDSLRVHPAARSASDILAEAQATALLTGGAITSLGSPILLGRRPRIVGASI